MKILSLFDGMACGMIAMRSAGIEVESYDAYEIDKHATKVSTHNFPNIKHHGDVFRADFTQYEGVDFLIGGSPCTYWSIAQKNNRETEASGIGWELFSQYVRAVKEAKPKFFIYENNKSMSAAIRESIDSTFGFEAVCINSALVSAQNRQRLYWVGVRNEDGSYSKVHVDQPEDKGILLKDILDNAMTWLDKSWAYTTRCQGAAIKDTLSKHRHTMVAEPVNLDNIYGFKSNDSYVQYDLSGKNHRSQDQRGYYPHSKHGTLNASSTESKTGVIELVKTAERGKSTYKVKDGMVTINGKQYPIKLDDGDYIFRKLTVAECKRLQTVPEWYDFSVISNSQAYKCLGNGWTCDVITHLINACQTAARRKWLYDLLGDCL